MDQKQLAELRERYRRGSVDWRPELMANHVFVEGDPWLESDAVFGVRSSCIAAFVAPGAGESMPDGLGATHSFYTLVYTFRLQPLGSLL